MFTMQNTEGFTQEQLNKMNAELESAIAELDQDATDYADTVKTISDRIFNKYC